MGRRYPHRVRSVLVVMAMLLAGCVTQAAPGPAVVRTAPPPWPAPRDGVSQFELAGVPASALDDRSNQRTFVLRIVIDGEEVPVVAGIGVDRPRALQGPVHTHDASGTLWLEGRGADEVTLDQFFRVWGVRFDARCLGATCGTLIVAADGRTIPDAGALRLASVARTLRITVTSG